MRRLVVPVLICLGCLVLAGCSNDDPKQPTASVAPSAPSGTEKASEELASVIDDANRVTPPLEAYFFKAGHATTLDEAVTALAENKLELTAGNEVGGYVYDDADEDFKLCIQGPTGAFATYDTSPMSLFETGETGGCP